MSENSHGQSILVVEDSVVTSVAVERVIERTLDKCRIVRAQSYFEAELLLSVYQFDLFVIDVHLPDGNGLDLLGLIVENNPGAAALVMTADNAPEHHDRSRAFGVQHFLTKPFRPETLSRAVRECLAHQDRLRQDSLFSVALKRLSVSDVVQLKCLNRASARLEVAPKGEAFRIGTIDIEQGQVINAEIHDETQSLLANGHQAFSQIIHWREGVIQELDLAGHLQQTIQESWESLLLTSAQEVDEHVEEVLALQD